MIKSRLSFWASIFLICVGAVCPVHADEISALVDQLRQQNPTLACNTKSIFMTCLPEKCVEYFKAETEQCIKDLESSFSALSSQPDGLAKIGEAVGDCASKSVRSKYRKDFPQTKDCQHVLSPEYDKPVDSKVVLDKLKQLPKLMCASPNFGKACFKKSSDCMTMVQPFGEACIRIAPEPPAQFKNELQAKAWAAAIGPCISTAVRTQFKNDPLKWPGTCDAALRGPQQFAGY